MVIMTLLDTRQLIHPNGVLWDGNTLKPPLKLRDLFEDLRFHWLSYKRGNLNFFRRFKFLLLMIQQRVAYNLGWLLATHKYQEK